MGGVDLDLVDLQLDQVNVLRRTYKWYIRNSNTLSNTGHVEFKQDIPTKWWET